MAGSKVLDRFFNAQHHKWKKRTYAVFQCTCGNVTCRSDYSEWLKLRKTNDTASGPVDPHSEDRGGHKNAP